MKPNWHTCVSLTLLLAGQALGAQEVIRTPVRRPVVSLSRQSAIGPMRTDLGTPPKVTVSTPVILVDFEASPFLDGEPSVAVQRMNNGTSDLMGTGEYWMDVSRQSLDWRLQEPYLVVSLPRTAAYYGGDRVVTPVADRLEEFLRTVLAEAASHHDWGKFDNDGPDGIPSSGDDDGIVDAIIIAYATPGGSCSVTGNGMIWPHRWSLTAAIGEMVALPAGNTGLWADDYIAVPLYACDMVSPQPNGTLIHEMGHLLGLPDEYDVSGRSNGVGDWSLMGYGNYATEAAPSSLSPAALMALGWLNEEVVAKSGLYKLTPHGLGGSVLSMAGPDGEQLLVEMRTKGVAGVDHGIAASGVLVWKLDRARWSYAELMNTLNTDPDNPGLELVQADGARDLERKQNRGDAGDVWGLAGRSELGANTVPSLRTKPQMKSFPFDLTAIRLLSQDTAELVVRFQDADSIDLRITSESVDARLIRGPDRYELPWQGRVARGEQVRVDVVPSDLANIAFGDVLWSDGHRGAQRTITAWADTILTVTPSSVYRVLVSDTADGLAGSIPSTRTENGWEFWVPAGTQLEIRLPDLERVLYVAAHKGSEYVTLEPGLNDWTQSLVSAPLLIRVHRYTTLIDREAFTATILRLEEPLDLWTGWLDAYGNRNGILDAEDIKRALAHGRVRTTPTGMEVVR